MVLSNRESELVSPWDNIEAMFVCWLGISVVVRPEKRGDYLVWCVQAMAS